MREAETTMAARKSSVPDPATASESDLGDEAADTPGPSLSIGELAKRTGVSTRTIRYYEELGILPRPERTDGGTRRYPREYIFYVEGARTLKELGFGLEEIAELGKFALTGTWDSEPSRIILTRKLSELEHRIRVLNRLHDLVENASKRSGRDGDETVPPLLRWVGEDQHNHNHNQN
jgi:DNA-binding transcriptional MerR regulator